MDFSLPIIISDRIKIMAEYNVHITPIKTYLAVAAALMVLTVITVAVSFVDLGPYNVTVALVIASIKALLVAFFFMHLFYDSKVYLIIFSMALLFLTIFLTLTMFDTTTRGAIDKDKAAPINKEATIYQ
jgi:cytochrome c oxidase subunit 4